MWGQIGAAIADAAENTAATYRDDYYWHANKDLQRKYAENSIQWKVQDAKKAGIHPLAALGANTISYSPQSIGKHLPSGMGQNIERASRAGMDKEMRALQIRKEKALASSAESQAIVDAKLAKDFQDNTSNGIQPTNPVEVIPSVETAHSGNNSGMTAGSFSSASWTVMNDTLVAVPSKELAESMEEYAPAKAAFFYKHDIEPLWKGNPPKPTLAEMQRKFPNAIGMKRVLFGWKPVYKKTKKKSQRKLRIPRSMMGTNAPLYKK